MTVRKLALTPGAGDRYRSDPLVGRVLDELVPCRGGVRTWCHGWVSGEYKGCCSARGMLRHRRR